VRSGRHKIVNSGCFSLRGLKPALFSFHIFTRLRGDLKIMFSVCL